MASLWVTLAVIAVLALWFAWAFRRMQPPPRPVPQSEFVQAMQRLSASMVAVQAAFLAFVPATQKAGGAFRALAAAMERLPESQSTSGS